MIDIYDIEVFPNLFLYCGMNRDTKEKTKFIFHESIDDFKINFPFDFFEYHKDILKGQIGYNNLNYDSQVIQFILNNESNFKKEDINSVTNKIYEYSQKIINSTSFPDYPEWKLKVPQLDLFKIWHFDNKNRSTSLKWIQFMLDFENIQESEIPFYKNVDEKDIPIIEEYCWNDIQTTYELYKITKGETSHPLYQNINKIQLREDINQEFFIECYNYSDVKIGDKILKKKYCEIKGISEKDLPKPNKKIKSIKFKDCIPPYVSFQNEKLKNFYNSIKNIDIKIENV